MISKLVWKFLIHYCWIILLELLEFALELFFFWNCWNFHWSYYNCWKMLKLLLELLDFLLELLKKIENCFSFSFIDLLEFSIELL